MGWLNLRRIAIFSSLAAIVSILAAGIGGVPFLSLIIRALLSALGFGLLSLGASWILYRFLPELFESSQDPVQSEESGGQLNVMVGDEDSADFTPQYDANPVSASPSSIDDDSDRDEEFDTEQENPSEKSNSWKVEQTDFKEGDKLPDIESFSSDFKKDSGKGPLGESQDSSMVEEQEVDRLSDEPEVRGLGSTYVPANSEDDARSYFTQNSTPEEMAKAVRTVVKRDE